MANDPSPEEVYRRLRDHEERTDRVHAELDNRITQLARDTIPKIVFDTAVIARDRDLARVEREHNEDMARLKEDVIKPLVERVKKIEDRPAMTFGRWMAVAGVVAAFLGVILEAYATAKGHK